MRRFFALFLALVMLILCCACGETETTKKKKKKKVIIVKKDPSSSVTSDEESDDMNSSENNLVFDDNILVDTEEKVVSKITASNIGANYYVLKPQTAHPGVVGFDAHYNMEATDKRGRAIDTDRMVLSCDNPNVKIKGNVVTIPYSLRSGGETVEVYMYDTKYKNRKGKYTFSFRKFSSQTTFAEEFDGDTLNTDVWWTRRKDNSTIDANAIDVARVEDGMFIYDAYNIDTPHTNITTSGTFKQAYGCFSARIMQPGHAGPNHCAFWLCSDWTTPRDGYCNNYEIYLKNIQMPSESGGEIDIIERATNWGNKYATTFHWNGWAKYHRSEGIEPVVEAPIDGVFQVYSCVWTPEAIYWYYNDQLTWVYDGEGLGKNAGPMIIRLSFTNEKEDHSWRGPVDTAVYPFTSAVDWVRVWSLDDIGE